VKDLRMNLYDLLEHKNRLSVRVLKKNTIFRFSEMQNKYIYFLKEGFMKIGVVNGEDREVIKYLLKPGDLFGEIALLDEFENPGDYAVALEDAIVHFVEVEKMKDLMNIHPDLHREVNKQIAKRVKKAENRLLSMMFNNANARVFNFIYEFAREFGQAIEQGYEVRNFLIHDDIANLTATSRQTVSSTLNELRNKKLIEYNSRTIRIFFSPTLFMDKKPDW
jgi:CRP/FNR family cyclic AMP-dependent transcriptional regulator